MKARGAGWKGDWRKIEMQTGQDRGHFGLSLWCCFIGGHTHKNARAHTYTSAINFTCANCV